MGRFIAILDWSQVAYQHACFSSMLSLSLSLFLSLSFSFSFSVCPQVRAGPFRLGTKTKGRTRPSQQHDTVHKPRRKPKHAKTMHHPDPHLSLRYTHVSSLLFSLGWFSLECRCLRFYSWKSLLEPIRLVGKSLLLSFLYLTVLFGERSRLRRGEVMVSASDLS